MSLEHEATSAHPKCHLTQLGQYGLRRCQPGQGRTGRGDRVKTIRGRRQAGRTLESWRGSTHIALATAETCPAKRKYVLPSDAQRSCFRHSWDLLPAPAAFSLAAGRDCWPHPHRAQPLSKASAVVAFVGEQLFGALLQSTSTPAGRLHCLNHTDGEPDLVADF